MKRLVKISDYYYVVDTGIEIKIGSWYQENDHIDQEFGTIRQFLRTDIHNPNVCCAPFIATTNPNIPLPQIDDVDDELVGKEVEVDFIPNYKESLAAFEYGISKTELAIIKPISKETPHCKKCGEMFDPYNWKEVKEVCSKCDAEIWAIETHDKTSTNETLEGVVYIKPNLESVSLMAKLYCSDVIHKNVGEHCYKAGYIAGHLAGYKHAESKIYSEDEVEKIIVNLIASDEFDEIIKETIIGRQKELAVKWFNNNKK